MVTRPAHVILPLSPNHGIFGYDGLYAESKLGLEALVNKWKSEGNILHMNERLDSRRLEGLH
jgi:3-oxoacyl-ACP reductase-like protein